MVESMRSHELTMVFFGGMFFGTLIDLCIVAMFGINAGVAFVAIIPIIMLIYDSMKK